MRPSTAFQRPCPKQRLVDVTAERMHTPDATATARYRAGYAGYRRLAQAMQGPWDELQLLERQHPGES